MLDPNLQQDISKAYAKLGDISYAIALNMMKGKDASPSQKKLYEQGIKMRIILRVLLRQVTFNPVTNQPTLYRLTETQVNKFIRCLIEIGNLSQFPIVPTLIPNVNPIIVSTGLQGNPGVGIKGDKGDTGFDTDFLVANASATTVIIDQFPITSAKSAKWDYVIVSNTGKQRASLITGTWKSDGSALELFDDGTDDIGGDTGGLLEFSLNFSGGNIQLVATITSETWLINGTRSFIPRNGNGSGAVNNVLTYGSIYIGNISNQATQQVVSGVVSISPSGVVSFTNQSIVDATINNAANITLSKLASLNNNIVPITNGSGKLISSGVTATTLGYLDISSSLTTQLGTKITDPLTSIGDLLIRNASNLNARLAIGSTNQVLTVIGGVPTWQNVPGGITGLTAGYIPVANGATSIVNSVITQSGSAITIAGTLEVQSGFRTSATGSYFKILKYSASNVWNMDTTAQYSITYVTLGISGKNILMTSVSILGLLGSVLSRYNLCSINYFNGLGNGSIDTFRDNFVGDVLQLSRVTGGFFDGTNFNNASIEVTIVYE